jgi:hypothetical protein
VNIDPIIVAMASCVQMLDTSHPDEVDPDFAVKVQEVMGEYLLELPASDEPELRATLLRIAADRAESDPTIAEQLRMWADNLHRN